MTQAFLLRKRRTPPQDMILVPIQSYKKPVCRNRWEEKPTKEFKTTEYGREKTRVAKVMKISLAELL